MKDRGNARNDEKWERRNEGNQRIRHRRNYNFSEERMRKEKRKERNEKRWEGREQEVMKKCWKKGMEGTKE